MAVGVWKHQATTPTDVHQHAHTHSRMFTTYSVRSECCDQAHFQYSPHSHKVDMTCHLCTNTHKGEEPMHLIHARACLVELMITGL